MRTDGSEGRVVGGVAIGRRGPKQRHGSRLVMWAGGLITACGVGHTIGALVQTVPRYGGRWLTGTLWEDQNRNLAEMTPVTAGFWFSAYSFGPPLILWGLSTLALARRNVVPPRFVAGALVAWTLFGEIVSGPSPLLLLVLAAILLLVAAHRAEAERARLA